MKLRDIHRQTINESLAKYMAVTLAKLKTKRPEELFDGDSPKVDLDKLAAYITGVRLLATPHHRAQIDDGDLGLDCERPSQLYKLLDSIPVDDRDENEMVNKAFDHLKSLRPGTYREERERLEHLVSGTEDQKREVLERLTTLSRGFNEIFAKAQAAAK